MPYISPDWIAFANEQPPLYENILCFGYVDGKPRIFITVRLGSGLMFDERCAPSHWMRLPEPPAKTKEDAEND